MKGLLSRCRETDVSQLQIDIPESVFPTYSQDVKASEEEDPMVPSPLLPHPSSVGDAPHRSHSHAQLADCRGDESASVYGIDANAVTVTAVDSGNNNDNSNSGTAPIGLNKQPSRTSEPAVLLANSCLSFELLVHEYLISKGFDNVAQMLKTAWTDEHDNGTPSAIDQTDSLLHSFYQSTMQQQWSGNQHVGYATSPGFTFTLPHAAATPILFQLSRLRGTPLPSGLAMSQLPTPFLTSNANHLDVVGGNEENEYPVPMELNDVDGSSAERKQSISANQESNFYNDSSVTSAAAMMATMASTPVSTALSSNCRLQEDEDGNRRVNHNNKTIALQNGTSHKVQQNENDVSMTELSDEAENADMEVEPESTDGDAAVLSTTRTLQRRKWQNRSTFEMLEAKTTDGCASNSNVQKSGTGKRKRGRPKGSKNKSPHGKVKGKADEKAKAKSKSKSRSRSKCKHKHKPKAAPSLKGSKGQGRGGGKSNVAVKLEDEDGNDDYDDDDNESDDENDDDDDNDAEAEEEEEDFDRIGGKRKSNFDRDDYEEAIKRQALDTMQYSGFPIQSVDVNGNPNGVAMINLNNFGLGFAANGMYYDANASLGEFGFDGLHPEEQELRCKYNECHKTFTKLTNLRRHERLHLGHKPYACQHELSSGIPCSKSFARRADLRAHERIHTGEKPYSCTQCDRRFARNSDWRSHERTHQGIKPFHCSYENCGKKFARRADANKHLKTHPDGTAEVMVSKDLELLQESERATLEEQFQLQQQIQLADQQLKEQQRLEAELNMEQQLQQQQQSEGQLSLNGAEEYPTMNTEDDIAASPFHGANDAVVHHMSNSG